MATSEQLAEMTVDFVTNGVSKVQSDIDGIGGKLGKSSKAADLFAAAIARSQAAVASFSRSANQVIESVSKSISSITSAASKFTLGGTLGIGGILSQAGAGTVEMQQLGAALEYAARVVGDSLAPYVRMATDAVIDFVKWFQSLDKATVEAATEWVVMATAVSGFVVAAAGVASVVATVIGSFVGLGSAIFAVVEGIGGMAVAIGSAFLGPVGLAVASIGGLVAAGAYMFGFFDTESEKTSNAMDDANKSWTDHLMDWATKAVNFVIDKLNWMVRQYKQATNAIAATMAAMGENLGIMKPGTLDLVMKNWDADLQGGGISHIKGLGDMANRFANGIGVDTSKNPLRDISNYLAGLKEREKARQDNGGNKGFTRVGSVQFESLSDTWMRLNKSLGAEDMKQDQMQKTLDEINATVQVMGGAVQAAARQGGAIGP
ncbi:hypothetical protein KIH39_04675 [Telmatocola sphagniphila]|uniref:Uncharacterized protein n=1 Tax=Telmatocola sphagniphila TaxID=1123043 RepID=A0A8E6BA57_9BACT|nr:hypothetical protein [Telmatocola sphagniphila]QVL33215.1 hypothetical protein KIH39_04675 [Telmatocola sphagniphila]